MKMENVIMIAGFLAAGTLALVMFGVYSVYGGFRAELCNAKVGQVFNFEYLQPLNGERKRVLAKVLDAPICLDDKAIASMNARSSYRRNDPKFERTHHLVTCQTADGNIRQFYCERVKNCRKPLLGSLVA
jgi:hypothetical protein